MGKRVAIVAFILEGDLVFTKASMLCCAVGGLIYMKNMFWQETPGLSSSGGYNT